MRLVLICLLLAGCTPFPRIDEKLEREIFMECLHSVPAGPQKTTFNDWDEVVEQCRMSAAQMSTE